jgi:hypothetical protein
MRQRGLAEWSVDGETAQLALAGSHDGLHGAFAAIGHRTLDQRRLGQRLAQPEGDGRRDIGGAQAVFE